MLASLSPRFGGAYQRGMLGRGAGEDDGRRDGRRGGRMMVAGVGVRWGALGWQPGHGRRWQPQTGRGRGGQTTATGAGGKRGVLGQEMRHRRWQMGCGRGWRPRTGHGCRRRRPEPADVGGTRTADGVRRRARVGAADLAECGRWGREEGGGCLNTPPPGPGWTLQPRLKGL